jgi:hypothetical protein
MPIRRPLTEAEKQLRREKSREWHKTPEAAAFRERQRKRRIKYNKTKVNERLSPTTRKKLSERLTSLNKKREWSAEERGFMAEQARLKIAAGIFRRGPMSEAEKEMHRQRMLGNSLGKGHVCSPEVKAAASARMKAKNPMRSAESLRLMQATLIERYGEDYHSKLFKRLWAEVKIKGKPLSERARKMARNRMKHDNPMKNAEVAARVAATLTPERRKKMGDRLRQTWKEGKIVPAMFHGKGNVKGANKTERKLFPILSYFHGRFVGDGTFWIKNTASGICRNPDFIFGSGKDKIALLVHGTYWHRHQETTEMEINDYHVAGWHLFVLWTRRIQDWMRPAIKAEIKSWLAAAKSSPPQKPVIRQFMTWNADRITIAADEITLAHARPWATSDGP